MSADAELRQAYAEWQRLTEAEGQAIRAGNWIFVAECQCALGKVGSLIDTLACRAREENPPPAASAAPQKFSPRATILNLIELQRRNLAALEQRRQRLSDQIEHVTRMSRNLRGIQRTYASPAPAGWSSYS